MDDMNINSLEMELRKQRAIESEVQMLLNHKKNNKHDNIKFILNDPNIQNHTEIGFLKNKIKELYKEVCDLSKNNSELVENLSSQSMKSSSDDFNQSELIDIIKKLKLEKEQHKNNELNIIKKFELEKEKIKENLKQEINEKLREELQKKSKEDLDKIIKEHEDEKIKFEKKTIEKIEKEIFEKYKCIQDQNLLNLQTKEETIRKLQTDIQNLNIDKDKSNIKINVLEKESVVNKTKTNEELITKILMRENKIKDKKPVSEPVSKPLSEPVSQPVSEPVSKPLSEPVSEPVSKPLSEPVSEPVSQFKSKNKTIIINKSEKFLKKSSNSLTKPHTLPNKVSNLTQHTTLPATTPTKPATTSNTVSNTNSSNTITIPRPKIKLHPQSKLAFR
tara:strand:+ start:13184 stop:14353 length:1170 start_codon:yes stop_codon:yes gene_type:complete